MEWTGKDGCKAISDLRFNISEKKSRHSSCPDVQAGSEGANHNDIKMP
jgi:hypothetical protein